MNKVTQKEIVKSFYYTHSEIFDGIRKLFKIENIDADITYSKGSFYKNTSWNPEIKFDLFPQTQDTIMASCTNLPISSGIFNSVMYDPPFLSWSKVDGIMKKRFGKFKNELNQVDFYKDSLVEINRILKSGGYAIIKCQDGVSGGKSYWWHMTIYNLSNQYTDMVLEDMFILEAKNRPISPNMAKQQHTRKYHSYFMVFRKK